MSIKSIAHKAGFQVSARAALEVNQHIKIIERAVQRSVDSGQHKRSLV